MAESIPAPTAPVVRNLVVIGLGLIGGSLAKAARLRGVCRSVYGVALTDDICDRALELGIVDKAVTQLQDIAPLLGTGDVIFIAVPTLSVKPVLQQIKDCISAEVTITDGASVKGSVLRDVQEVFGHTPAQVVLGHPIAGSEKSGVEAANPDLYVKHRVILTPCPETGAEHLARVTALWQKVDAEVLHLDIVEHDEILAATSHLPHAIAFSLVDTLAHDSQNQNIFRYAAGGFRDFTRIASSDEVMWRDIMLANDKAVLKSIDLFSANLARLRTAIEQHDEQAMLGVFTRAKAARDHFSQMLARKAEIAAATCQLRVAAGAALAGVTTPGDFSAAACFIVAATISEGSDVTLANVGLNPARAGVLPILARMGADMQLLNPREIGGEPVADIRVRHAELAAIAITAEQLLTVVDELPTLLIAAAYARGTTVVSGTAQLPEKAAKGIQITIEGLSALGIACTTSSDSISVRGGKLSGGEVDSHDDHRVAIALAVAGSHAQGPVLVKNCASIARLSPGFVQAAKRLGISIEQIGS